MSDPSPGLLNPSPDIQDIRRGISLLFAGGDVVEVRVPKTLRFGTVSGYFDDPDLLANAIYKAECYCAEAVYCTLNRLDPQLLARACNRLKERVELTTADNNIVRRNWLPLDLDPVRPAGVSSNEKQHTAAIDRAYLVSNDLKTEWGNPIVADSGNGAHLLYRIDLPNDKDSLAFIADALSKVHKCYSDDIVRVDVTPSNAARIWKAYGTVSRKGDNLREYPHRVSRILEVPGA